MKDVYFRLQLLKGDITNDYAGAIVNAANSHLIMGGGVDGAIHRAAGVEELSAALADERAKLPGGRLEPGECVVTDAFKMTMVGKIIHTVGPRYDNLKKEWCCETLYNCYRNVLDKCGELGIRTISFPSVSTGVYGYPLGEAAPIAIESVLVNAPINGLTYCCFRLFDNETLDAYTKALGDIYGER